MSLSLSPATRPRGVPTTLWSRAGVSRGDVVLVLAAVAATAAFVAFTLLGFRLIVITSGSMSPTLHVGDLVVSRVTTIDAVRPGQVVTFRSAVFRDELVTHRLVKLTPDPADPKGLQVTTKGDANRAAEHWTVPIGTPAGTMVAHVRYAGWWISAVGSGPGQVTLVALALAGLAVMAVSQVRGGR